MNTFGIFNDMYVYVNVNVYEYVSVWFSSAKSTSQTEPNHLLSTCKSLKLNQTIVYRKTKLNLKLGLT